MTPKKGRLWIGTSGFQYDDWREVFYPRGLARSGWFGYYIDQFDTVEINATFYHLLSEKTFRAWKQRAPQGFCFALKLSRLITHQKMLTQSEEALDTFLSRAELLGKTLGPILVQLPPSLSAHPDRLDRFFQLTPRRYRWVIEFRHPSWLCEDVYKILDHHDVALCIHDKINDHPWRMTTSWIYVRFHGPGNRGLYTPQKLTAWARRIDTVLSQGLDVHAYFNNDLAGHAPRNARELRRYLLHQTGDSVLAKSYLRGSLDTALVDTG